MRRVAEKITAELVQETIANLVRFADQIVDLSLRRHFFVRRIEPLDDEVIAEVLHEIQARALQGDSACKALVSSGIDAQLIFETLGKLRVGRIYHAAARQKHTDVCNLFRTIKPVKSPEGDEESFLKYGLPNLTVGERASAARSLDPDLLTRVGYDVSPRVIRDLLTNPRLTEKMVVAISARRPNRPEILQVIFESAKWRARPDVRLSLVRNPYTPPQIAMALLPTLKRQELREVLNDGNVHREIREAAEQALVKKKEAEETLLQVED